MKEEFLKLTNTVYKVLEFFPEADPLKNRAKDKALAIMEHLVLLNETSGWMSFQTEKVKVKLLEDIDMILGYLWIAKSQGWLNSVNCLIISNEYEKIKKQIEPVIEFTQRLPFGDLPRNREVKKEIVDFSVISAKAYPQAASGAEIHSETKLLDSRFRGNDISARQRKILEFLKEKEKAQVMDLQTILPDITKRTIRRDLDQLMELGKIARFGDFNQVFYQIS